MPQRKILPEMFIPDFLLDWSELDTLVKGVNTSCFKSPPDAIFIKCPPFSTKKSNISPLARSPEPHKYSRFDGRNEKIDDNFFPFSHKKVREGRKYTERNKASDCEDNQITPIHKLLWFVLFTFTPPVVIRASVFMQHVPRFRGPDEAISGTHIFALRSRTPEGIGRKWGLIFHSQIFQSSWKLATARMRDERKCPAVGCWAWQPHHMEDSARSSTGWQLFVVSIVAKITTSSGFCYNWWCYCLWLLFCYCYTTTEIKTSLNCRIWDQKVYNISIKDNHDWEKEK